MRIPFSRPSIDETDLLQVRNAWRSGWLTTGPKTAAFEEQFAWYAGVEHAIAVSSCSIGLELVLAAEGVGAGDEVILPTNTFASAVNAVKHLGAEPVLVDVDMEGQIAPVAVKAALTDRTRAVMPVHYAGRAFDWDRLQRAVPPRVLIVQDAAHAAGTEYEGAKVGSFGTAVFSFYTTKNMTTGEGGMITTNDSDLAGSIRTLANHGITKDSHQRYLQGDWAYDLVEHGYKANMPDVLAAVGITQLEQLDQFIQQRQGVALRYDLALPGPERDFCKPQSSDDRPHAYHLYPVLLPESVDRNLFIEKMAERGVQCSVHFIPLHRMSVFAHRFSPRDFPVSERCAERMVSLPMSTP